MVYQPAEDSYLLQDILKKEIPPVLKENPNLKFLEIGSGSGIHLETAKDLGVKKENISSADVDEKSVLHCSSLGFKCIRSNLFENIQGKYDIIIFNPPYLPKDSREPTDSQIATTGGEHGNEVINEFLNEAKEYLEKNGKIYIITSSLSGGINWGDWNKILLGSEKLFFEELFVWCVFED